jgi:hypothetical protein
LHAGILLSHEGLSRCYRLLSLMMLLHHLLLLHLVELRVGDCEETSQHLGLGFLICWQ